VTHTDIGRNMLNRLLKDLEELAEVEKAPKLEGYSMIMILSPKKSLRQAKGDSHPPKPEPPKPSESIGPSGPPPAPGPSPAT